MNTGALDWNDIRLMLALAQHGSMSAAGRSLGVDVSTISRRLAAVEAAMHTRLFIRGSQGYQPTAAGAVFVTHAERVLGEVRALETQTRAEGQGIAGPVSITAVGALFDHWLLGRLPELLRSHPRLSVKLIADDHNLSFVRREADFALRLAQPTRDAALLMRKLGQVGLAVYQSAALKAVPRSKWGEQPWLAYNDELSGTPEMRWLAALNPGLDKRVQASSVTTLIQACEAGLGLALLPCFCDARPGLKRLGAKPELHRDIWLLSHRDAAKIRRFRVVKDWLVTAFEAGRSMLAG